ncbi:protein of unknown function [Agrobacterium pusense]|uniref:Uncharacterized protein n=1 Tax=Agrobacterium pusense TaxID=648995 RepID=U4PTS6_9HYPH|nr:protein of unknown function [Agrobacterium pusense]
MFMDGWRIVNKYIFAHLLAVFNTSYGERR